MFILPYALCVSNACTHGKIDTRGTFTCDGYGMCMYNFPTGVYAEAEKKTRHVKQLHKHFSNT